MTLTTVEQTMILQGDRTRLKDLLKERLTACGWRDDVRLLCRNAIEKKNGVPLNVDQIVQEITPEARSKIPDAVKKELLMKIKARLESQEGIEL